MASLDLRERIKSQIMTQVIEGKDSFAPPPTPNPEPPASDPLHPASSPPRRPSLAQPSELSHALQRRLRCCLDARQMGCVGRTLLPSPVSVFLAAPASSSLPLLLSWCFG